MRTLLTNRGLHILILLILLGGAAFVRTRDDAWAQALRFAAFDTYNRLAPRTPSDSVVIVDIDESSLAALGQWPWPRDIMARLVDNLSTAGAQTIVFDMVFAETDRTAPEAIIARLPENTDETVRQSLHTLPDNDQTFAKAIENSNNTVTGFIWSPDKKATRRMPVLSRPILSGKGAKDLVQTVPRMSAVTTNIPVLSKAAAGNGSFGVSPEIDGIIRRVPLLFSFAAGKEKKPRLYPSLAVETLRVAQGAKTITKLRALKDAETGPLDPPLRMKIGAYDIPLDHDGLFFVRYAPQRTKNYLSAVDVIAGLTLPEKIDGKIVFIGTSAAGLKDIRSTPLNLYIPGVEVHANVVEQILTGDMLLRPKLLEGGELLGTVLVGALIILVFPFIGAVAMAVFTTLLIGAVFALSWGAFQSYGLLLDPVYPSLCLLVLSVMSALLTYIRTEAERKQVREAFGLYISPDFMTELTKNPDKLRLGGEVRDLTIMFTDIRSFTTISEHLSPEELIRLMNDFLTPMSDLVMSHRGTIDKYMGDAMMAFWNAPLDDSDHARHACQAALKMNDALVPINEGVKARAEEEGRDPVLLRAGIGINSGPTSVGNMGSKQRFAYSALGDPVNLASRLESQTKTYGVNILVGEDTIEKAPGFAALELDLLRVKGKIKPVRIFALLGDEDMAASGAFQKWDAAQQKMLKAYRAGAFKDALKHIDACEKHTTTDLSVFYTLYRERITTLQTNPPGDGWDGVWTADSK